MFEIKGKVTTAICYAKVAEDEAIEQIRRMCDYVLKKGGKVRTMPDVHAGNIMPTRKKRQYQYYSQKSMRFNVLEIK